MSQPIEEEIRNNLACQEDVLVSYDPVVEDIESQSVVANIRAINLFNDTIDSLVFTEPLSGTFSIISLPCQGLCEGVEFKLDNAVAPLRLDSADFDGDGDNELILSDIGTLFTSELKNGKVIIIDLNQTTGSFVEKVIVENIGRVTCAEAADLDGDDDFDLTLCEFGNKSGSIGWLENNGEDNWTRHILENKSGSIEAIPFDIDSDGDLDIVSVISQLSEEIVVYWNDGSGNFQAEILFKANNTFFGMSGINLADYDEDGDMDIFFTNGDIMDFDFPSDENFWDYHGLSVLENINPGEFEYRRLLEFSGAYDSALYDIDGDGTDEIIVIGFRPLDNESIDYGSHPNIGWLDFNNSSWTPVFPLNDLDTSLISLETIDLNGDGIKELLAANHDIFSANNVSRIISIKTELLETCIEI